MAIDFKTGNLVFGRPTATNVPASVEPLTLAGWLSFPATPTANSNGYCIALSSDATTPSFFMLKGGTDGSNNLNALAVVAATSGSPNQTVISTSSGIAAAANVWFHVCGVFTSNTARAAFLNGGFKGTGATSVQPLSITVTAMGGLWVPSFTIASGDALLCMADVAVWNVALTDAEVAALGRGMSPLFVRPSALQAYWPLETIANAGFNRVKNGVADRTLSPVGSSPGTLTQGSNVPPVTADRYYWRPVGWRGTPRPVTAVAVTASNLAVSSPTLDAGTITQAYALAATALETGAPALGASALAQGHALTANALAGSAPALGAPLIGQKHVLAANPASAGSPVLDVAVFNQKVPLAAVAASAGAPVLGVPACGQSYVLSAASLTASAPTVGVATFGQSHAPVAVALAAGSPAISSSTLAQTHILSASSLAAGAPALGTGTVALKINLLASNLAVSAPTVSAATITSQRHAFQAFNFSTISPSFGTLVLKQKQVIIATGLAAGSPVIGVPVASQGAPLFASSMAVGRPTIPVAVLSQKYPIFAPRLTNPSPVIGTPKLGTIAPPLVAAGLTVGSPVIAQPVLKRSHILAVLDFETGRPQFSQPDAEWLAPPMVWLTTRVKRWSRDPKAEFYDDDDTQFGRPVKQAIFANLNDEIELTLSSGTFPGRTAPGRGPAEEIIPVKPLSMADKKLQIDMSEVEQLRADVAALTAVVAAQRADFERLLRQTKTFIPRDLTVGAPVIGTPRASVTLPVATGFTAASPTIGRPMLVRIP